MRLIDADAIKEKIDNIWNGRPLSVLGARILAMIDNAPSIDIVRCRECRYGEYRADFDDYECRYSGCGLVYNADDFCSYGERSSE